MNAGEPFTRGDHRGAVVDARIGALQGQDPAAGEPVASLSGALLRTLVLRAHEDRATEDAAQAEALLERWAAMGMLKGRRRPVGAGWLQAVRNWLPQRDARLALSTMALVGAVGLGVWVSSKQSPNGLSDTDSDASVSRGDERPLQITAYDPSALALRIEAVLQSHQVPTRRVELSSGAVQLQAKLPADAAGARQDLAPLGIAIPSHGRLDVMISRTR